MSSADNNPILNSPYDEPARHYATDTGGNLNSRDVRKGRRLFVPDVPQVPLGQQPQGSMFDLNDFQAEYGTHLVNRLRDEVRRWRLSGYQGTTSRVTRDLLDFWFRNRERQAHQSLFFAQREAVETAIWLNEQAALCNSGNRTLKELRDVHVDQSDGLPRIAFKMATGSGKTVVMACLVLYHFLNRREYRNDTRFADYFLVLAPGITIRDRLSVLFPDAGDLRAHEAHDYYRARHLVPSAYEGALQELAHRVVVTNYHDFLPRVLSGNKRAPTDGKIGLDGQKTEAREDEALVVRRVLKGFKAGRRIVVINDEAHHCYLPRAKGKDTELDNSETENERAAVWFSGVRAVAQRFKLQAVYDLSATPYYLSGSGYTPYSLFPWVVSDFGLIEAIEAGLVKIPYLPVEDSSHAIDEPVLRNLYEHCRDQLPKKGARGQRKAEKGKAGEPPAPVVGEAEPNLPPLVRSALEQFYRHYADYDEGLRKKGEQRVDLFSEPPVFIVVCSNTQVSREVFKHIAGYETVDDSGEPYVVPGRLDLFSNFDPVTRLPRSRPPTLLIDSDALEHSGQIDDSFRKIFAPEIERFKRDYRLRHPERSVDLLTDGDLLREVVNTVGKPDALGSHIRCVVSVSMLTEGWDANTVTHVMGLRAFGSQLLCEQVAGRALRRRQYFIDPKTGKFPPEYAHIIGVPFKLYQGGDAAYAEPPEYATLRALPERGELEIRFPNLIGYRVETEPARLQADFSAVPKFRIDTTKLPVQSMLGTAVSGDRQALELRVDDLRDQQVVFELARIFMRGMAEDAPGRADLRVFSAVRAIVQRWYDEVIEVVGEADRKWKRLVIHESPVAIVESINRGIVAHAAERERVLPLLNHYNPTGSTANVFGHTAKPTYPGRKSHVNLVVADTDLWEQVAAKHLDRIKEVESYVKNAFLGFVIPYVQDGKEHKYLPDYIVRLRTPKLRRANLILEITGFNKDKAIKRWYVRERWLPAVNNARVKLGLPPWYFEEVEDIDKLKPQLEAAIRRIVAEVDAAPDSVGEALDLLARLPADFYVEGREDRPVFEQREPFE